MRRRLDPLLQVAPGLAVVAVVAIAATFLALLCRAPVMLLAAIALT